MGEESGRSIAVTLVSARSEYRQGSGLSHLEGIAFAVIARGDRRGKVVSAHRTRVLAELAAKAFGGKSPEIVEIATFA